MTPDPSISFLVPSFNAAPFIEATLASVREQLGPLDEVLLQDGGSNDGTLDVMRRIAVEDRRFHLVSQSDEGQSDALNKALTRAQGEYVMWLNADDLLLPDSVRRIRAALGGAASPVVAWGGHRYINASGATIEEYLPQRFDHRLFMRRGCYVFSGSIAVNRERLRSLGGFSPRLHYCMDLDLMFRLAQLQKPEIRRIEGPVGALRWHDASKSGSTALPFLKEGWNVRAMYVEGVGDQLRRVEALIVLGIAHATVGLRHSAMYRRFRRVVISPHTSVKTTAPGAHGTQSS